MIEKEKLQKESEDQMAWMLEYEDTPSRKGSVKRKQHRIWNENQSRNEEPKYLLELSLDEEPQIKETFFTSKPSDKSCSLQILITSKFLFLFNR